MTSRAPLRLTLALALAALLTGCGVSPTTTPVKVTPNHVTGSIHGGQQPVSGATIQLYTVNTSTTGGPATPLIAASVTSGPDGSFNITNDYTCTNATLVYLTATGGNPGLSSNNPNLALMAALGNCADLTAGTFVNLNELTTVAAVYALAPYMTSLTAVGSPSSSSLTSAFSLANQFVNVASGTAPGTNLPTGDTVPTSLLNTLGDIVAACINTSGGTAANTSTPCGSLFSLTTPPATPAPTDTIQALLDLALNPTLNTQALFNLSPGSAVFQPTLTQSPPDLRLRLQTPTSQQALQFSAASLTLPATAVGVTSAATPITITNSTSSAVTSLSLTITGTSAADFAVTSNCGTTLAANSNCTAQITTTPTATGTRNAYIIISSSTPDSPQYIPLSVSASAGVPHAVFSALSYSPSVPGTTRDFTLSNTGTAPLRISGFSTFTGYFSVSNNCGSSLDVGGSCIVSVVNNLPGVDYFYPRYLYPVLAPPTDLLSISSNDPSPNPGIFISGTNASNISYKQTSLVFPPTAIGSSATNTLTSLAMSSSYPFPTCPTLSVPAPFSFGSPTPTYGGKNDPVYYTSCAYTVTFAPTAAGSFTAALAINATDYVPLTGIGLSAAYSALTLTPATLNLTNSTPGTVSLSNYTSNTVNIQSISVGTGFTQTNNCGASLLAQSLCTITITATATAGGGTQALLTVIDDGGTQYSAVTGTQLWTFDFGTAAVGVKSQLFYGPYLASGGSGNTAYTTSNGDFTGSSCNNSFCHAYIYFTPTATGVRTGISSFSQQNSYYLTENYLLKGIGVAAGPVASFSQNYVDAAAVGSTASGPFTVYNNGTATLYPNVTFTGTNASEFSPGGCTSVAAGSSCTLYASFTPTQVGPRYATLVLTDSVTGRVYTLPLEGAGTYTLPTSSPTTLAFSGTAVNTASAPQTLTIASPSQHPISASSSNAAFALSKSTCAQNDSPCTLTVVYNPTTAATSTGTITVTDTVTGAATTVSVTGGGPAVTVSPTSVTFSSRPVGSTSLSQTITVANQGESALTSLSVSKEGTNSADYVVINNCSSTLAASASCTVSVSFAPTVSGSRTATVTFSGTSGSGLPVTVNLTGTAQ